MDERGEYKYIRYIYKDYLDELYDLQADPDELYNLAVRTEYHETKLEMRTLLAEELRKNGADFLHLLPDPIQPY